MALARCRNAGCDGEFKIYCVGIIMFRHASTLRCCAASADRHAFASHCPAVEHARLA
jgi:hypothetical protein